MGHKHHIIPKHLGGTDEPHNLIEVTVKEHAQIHYNLWMIYGRWEDELAYKALSGLISSEECAREASRKANTGDRNPNKRPEVRAKWLEGTAKMWEITFPDGHKEVIKNLKAFCRNYNLDSGVMGRVARKEPSRLQHKGFRCRKLT